MSTRSLAYWIALVGGAEVGWRGHLADDARLFHAGMGVLALMLAWTAWRLLRRRRPLAALAAAVAALAPVLLSALAWAGVPAHAVNPLAAWWADHELERRVLTTIVQRGPLRMFDQEIALDHRGFRVEPELPVPPAGSYRIVALGGSTTFGATRSPDEHSWPALLQQRMDGLSCRTPVHVFNAGRVGRALGGSFRHFDRELLALRPDLIVYYPSPQDVAGMLDQVASGVTPEAVVPERTSALLRRAEIAWRWRGVEERFRAALEAEPDSMELSQVPLTSTYRRFLLEMRRRGIEVALATASLAVSGDSSQTLMRQHEALDTRTRSLVLANRFHARFVRGLAARYRATFIDTRPGLDGGGEALFIDLFHLTEAGRERLARNVFQGLLPLLRRDEPGCTPGDGGADA